VTEDADPVYELLLRARPGDEVADPAELVRAWLARPSWHRLAACRGVGADVFFPVRGGTFDLARHLCSTCPVAAECLAEALALDEKADEGFRAGMSARQRRDHRQAVAAA